MSGPSSDRGELAVTDAGAGLPLSALLSQALVALTIELDNEFEHRMVHWTTTHGPEPEGRRGPWLTSAVMYLNCLRFLEDDGITVGELERRARTATNLDGMRRWDYLRIEPRPAAGAGKRPARVGPDSVLRPTDYGRQARAVWQPLFGEVDERWRRRFGEPLVARLRGVLRQIVAGIEHPLPDCMPILGYGLRTFGRTESEPERQPAPATATAPDTAPDTAPAPAPAPAPATAPAPAPAERSGGPRDDVTRLSLHALLSRALLAFTVAFERRSRLSLAISADVVRVLDAGGVSVRDLPGRSGVSKEAVSMATGFLEREGYGLVEPLGPPARGRLVRLIGEGEAARRRYGELTAAIAARWPERFGAAAVTGLRESLEQLVGDGTPHGCPLFAGLTPYPDGWRASVPRPRLLPHFPMVLHRGGFPDGG
jgi:hypothetical protein